MTATAEPVFSVIIPTYNRAAHIEAAILSVLGQTFIDFEILIIDDGSTDATRETVARITDVRVKYIHQQNRERGAARNNGIRNSSGRIICFLDSDDVLLPDHLQTAYDAFEKTPAMQVFCTSFVIRNENEDRHVYLPDDINSALSSANVISCNGIFIRRAFMLHNMFSETRELSALEDWELWLRVASQTRLHSSRSVTSVIMQHDERSVMQTNPELIEKKFDSFFHHIEGNPILLNYLGKSKNALLANCETYMALHIAISGKNKKRALLHLRKGVILHASVIFTKRFLAIIKHLIVS
jgi:glycosyltransferase involved in cell wall biosynthesis